MRNNMNFKRVHKRAAWIIFTRTANEKCRLIYSFFFLLIEFFFFLLFYYYCEITLAINSGLIFLNTSQL